MRGMGGGEAEVLKERHYPRQGGEERTEEVRLQPH